MIEVYWARLANWGDQITKTIVETLSGEVAVHSSKEGKFIVVGSILEHARNNDIIWGSGSMFANPARVASNLKFYAVRGPLTRNIVNRQFGYNCPEIYGDPAILMPYIYSPKITNEVKIGILPHYIDKASVEHLRNKRKDIQILDIQSGIKETMRMVAKCKIILSSSLHGVILAESLGKKAAYIQMSDKVVGGDFKFNDYYTSTSRKMAKVDWRPYIKDIKIPSKIISISVDTALRSGKPKYNIPALLKACPFNKMKYFKPEDIPTINI